MSRFSLLLFCFFLSLHITFCFPLAAEAEINDEAFLFSAKTSLTAKTLLQEIRDKTKPGIRVHVRTLPALSSHDTNVKVAAERIYREQNLRDLLILVVKNPPGVIITGHNSIVKKIPGAEKIHSAMLQEFQSSRFDSGLINGIQGLRTELTAAFPLNSKESSKEATSLSGTPEGIISRILNFFKSSRGKPEPASGSHSPSAQFHIPNFFFYILYAVAGIMVFLRFRGGRW